MDAQSLTLIYVVAYTGHSGHGYSQCDESDVLH